MKTTLIIIGAILFIGIVLFLRKVLKTLGEMEEEYRRRQRWDD